MGFCRWFCRRDSPLINCGKIDVFLSADEDAVADTLTVFSPGVSKGAWCHIAAGEVKRLLDAGYWFDDVFAMSPAEDNGNAMRIISVTASPRIQYVIGIGGTSDIVCRIDEEAAEVVAVATPNTVRPAFAMAIHSFYPELLSNHYDMLRESQDTSDARKQIVDAIGNAWADSMMLARVLVAAGQEISTRYDNEPCSYWESVATQDITDAMVSIVSIEDCERKTAVGSNILVRGLEATLDIMKDETPMFFNAFRNTH